MTGAAKHRHPHVSVVVGKGSGADSMSKYVTLLSKDVRRRFENTQWLNASFFSLFVGAAASICVYGLVLDVTDHRNVLHYGLIPAGIGLLVWLVMSVYAAVRIARSRPNIDKVVERAAQDYSKTHKTCMTQKARQLVRRDVVHVLEPASVSWMRYVSLASNILLLVAGLCSIYLKNHGVLRVPYLVTIAPLGLSLAMIGIWFIIDSRL